MSKDISVTSLHLNYSPGARLVRVLSERRASSRQLGLDAGASKASSGISPQMSDIDGFNSANGSTHHQNMSSLFAATTLTMSRSPSTAV
jgi:hypothetical protein